VKLFTKTDLERCARLSTTLFKKNGIESDLELAVSDAVSEVVCEAEPVYTRFQVLDVARVAISIALASPGRGAKRAAETATDDVLGTV